MRNVFFVFVIALLGFSAFSCQAPTSAPNAGTCNSAGAASPSDAYRELYGCVKAKDKDGIRRVMSKATNAFVETVAGMQKQDVGKVYENGLTATTFAASLPEIRDERISEEFGKVEVWNEKDKRWEDLPFIKEDGSWKLAIGDDWKGSFKSPGKGRAQIEAEAANVNSNRMMPLPMKIETNANLKGIAAPPAANMANGKMPNPVLKK